MTGKAGGADFDFGWFQKHLVEELLLAVGDERDVDAARTPARFPTPMW